MNRSIAPEVNQIIAPNMIFPNRISCENNVDLFWIDEVVDDTIKLDIVWDAGSKYQNKRLISNFCNKLLLSGDKNTSAHQIADQIDSLGGYLSFDQNPDHAGFTIFGLKDSIVEIFDIVTKYFQSVEFLQTEIDKIVEIDKKGFEFNREKVSINARRIFQNNLFGTEHYYGNTAELEDFNNITQKDLIAFYQKHYINTSPLFFLVGDVNPNLIEKLKEFSKLFKPTNIHFNSILPTQNIANLYTEKKDAVQTAIRIGKPIINKTHENYIGFSMLNTILGGYFGSRLMANIREDKGYTYGIGSGVSILEDAAYFFISTEVGKENRLKTLNEVFYEFEQLINYPIPESELEIVKNYLLGNFLKNIDGPIAMMEKYKNIYFNNLSESYYTDYINGIQSITVKQIQNMAKIYLKKESFTVISYG